MSSFSWFGRFERQILSILSWDAWWPWYTDKWSDKKKLLRAMHTSAYKVTRYGKLTDQKRCEIKRTTSKVRWFSLNCMGFFLDRTRYSKREFPLQKLKRNRKPFCFSLVARRRIYYLAITSKLANQLARKVLFTCVVYTKNG